MVISVIVWWYEHLKHSIEWHMSMLFQVCFKTMLPFSYVHWNLYWSLYLFLSAKRLVPKLISLWVTVESVSCVEMHSSSAAKANTKLQQSVLVTSSGCLLNLQSFSCESFLFVFPVSCRRGTATQSNPYMLPVSFKDFHLTLTQNSTWLMILSLSSYSEMTLGSYLFAATTNSRNNYSSQQPL